MTMLEMRRHVYFDSTVGLEHAYIALEDDVEARACQQPVPSRVRQPFERCEAQRGKKIACAANMNLSIE